MSKTIWVTGASRGIGRAIAKKIADHYYMESLPMENRLRRWAGLRPEQARDNEETPCNLVINSRHEDADLNSIADYVTERGAHVLKLVGDVASDNDRQHMLKSIHERFGSVDVLINNAGISHIGLLQDMSPAQINDLISTNLTAAIALSALIVNDLLKSKNDPRIINISSVWGNVGASCEAVYSACKGGLNSFTKALAKELAPSHIPVNAIACGLIDTTMNSHLTPEEFNELCEEIPAGRAGKPEEVAELACYLLHATDYLTGQIITLDGGWV